MNGPANVFEIRIIKELIRKFLHPLKLLVQFYIFVQILTQAYRLKLSYMSYFSHANRSDFRNDVTVSVYKNCFEHVSEHVFDFIAIFFEFFAPEMKVGDKRSNCGKYHLICVNAIRSHLVIRASNLSVARLSRLFCCSASYCNFQHNEFVILLTYNHLMEFTTCIVHVSMQFTWRWVFSRLIETVKAMSTSAVINFMAAKVAVWRKART